MLAQDATKRWLTESYDYEPPHRGEVRKGVIVSIDAQGITVDIGLKRDGFVPRVDLERLEEEAVTALKTGQDVIARIEQPYDQSGNLILSLYAARQEKDWLRAQELLKVGEIWPGEGGQRLQSRRPAGQFWPPQGLCAGRIAKV